MRARLSRREISERSRELTWCFVDHNEVRLFPGERGFDTVELNASDTRSKRSITEQLAPALGCRVLPGMASAKTGPKGAAPARQRRVIIMDEVDGLSGNSDRGGSQELIKLIKTSQTPSFARRLNHASIRSSTSFGVFESGSRDVAREALESVRWSVLCWKTYVGRSNTSERIVSYPTKSSETWGEKRYTGSYEETKA